VQVCDASAAVQVCDASAAVQVCDASAAGAGHDDGGGDRYTR